MQSNFPPQTDKHPGKNEKCLVRCETNCLGVGVLAFAWLCASRFDPKKWYFQSILQITYWDLVLYSHGKSLWKLVDFGISVEANSTFSQATVYSRGTSGYRAPELLLEEATFTTRVDMWNLGCILYELITLKQAFPSDLEIRILVNSGDFPSLKFPSKFWQSHVSWIIGELLCKDPRNRPTASAAYMIFSSYSMVSNSEFATDLLDIELYPSVSDWKNVVESQLSDRVLLVRFAEMIALCGGERATQFLRTMAHQYIQNPHTANNVDINDYEDDTLWSLVRAVSKVGPDDETILLLKSAIHKGALADFYRDNYWAASHLLEKVTKDNSVCFWLWHKWCTLIIENEGCRFALGQSDDSAREMVRFILESQMGSYNDAYCRIRSLFDDKEVIHSVKFALIEFLNNEDGLTAMEYTVAR